MRKSIYSKEYKLFLRQLKAAREKAELTQKDVAKRIGETQSFVSKCERGERRIDIIELRAFCKAFKIPFLNYVKSFDRLLEK